MGSLGQVEGVQMKSRQETSAALIAEEKGQKEEDIVSIFLRRKSSRGKRRVCAINYIGNWDLICEFN